MLTDNQNTFLAEKNAVARHALDNFYKSCERYFYEYEGVPYIRKDSVLFHIGQVEDALYNCQAVAWDMIKTLEKKENSIARTECKPEPSEESNVQSI